MTVFTDQANQDSFLDLTFALLLIYIYGTSVCTVDDKTVYAYMMAVHLHFTSIMKSLKSIFKSF